MARNAGLMPTSTSGGIGRRLLAAVMVLVALSLLIHDPIGSANTVTAFFGWAGHVIDALSSFATTLAGRA